MSWVKWVGGGIAASIMASAIVFGVIITGGGASAAETDVTEDGAFSEAASADSLVPGIDGGLPEVMALAGPASDEWKALVAEKLGVTVEQLETAMSEARTELGLPEPGEGHPFRRGAIFGWHLHGIAAAAADIIGVEPSEIAKGLRDGKSLAQIAEENGVSREDLKAGLIASITEKINNLVANRRITQDRADEIISKLEQRIEDVLDRIQEYRAGLDQ